MSQSNSAEAAVGRVPSLAADEAIERSRLSRLERLGGRERVVAAVVGGLFVLVAAAMAVAAGPFDRSALALAAAYVCLYAAASRVEFEIGPGSAIPTQLLLVPMVLTLPPALVPACVGAGMLAGGAVDVARDRMHVQRALVLLNSSWHAVGPALVVWALAPDEPTWSAWPVYVLALLAQFAFDAAATATLNCIGRGRPPRALVSPLAWTFRVDASLAPVGLLAAFVAAETPAAVLLLLPFIVLLRLFATDRRARIDRGLELRRAFDDASAAARRDPLTGLGNRLAWEEAIATAKERFAAEGVPVTVVIVDTDGLKQLNDAHGHAFGDRVLVRLARVLRSTTPEALPVARIGGDEFGLVALGVDHVEGAMLASRLEAALRLAGGHDGVTVSASVGVASAPPQPTVADAILAADIRLYERKAGQ